MTTPIIITTLLLAPSIAAFIWSAVSGRHRPPLQTTAAIGLAAVFSFTGMGHFIKTEGMVEMMPPRMPIRHASVIASGFFEWALAVGLLLPRTRRLAAMISGAFLVAVLPINIWAAFNRSGMGGHQWGPVYLWIRVPLQGLMFAGAMLAAGRPTVDSRPEE